MAIKSELEDSDFSRLREASDYRAFLKAYLDLFNYSYSDFARQAGFARGFPGDIISGKRRLTSKSEYSFEQALKIPAKGKKLFRLLVAQAELDQFPEYKLDQLLKEIDLLKSQTWKRPRTQIKENTTALTDNGQTIDKQCLIIFAAAGDNLTGASFTEVQKRTGLSEKDILKYTSKLEQMGLVEIIDSTRILPKDLHLFLKTSDKSKILISSFIESVELAKSRIIKKDRDEDEFFFNSSFCINKQRLPELKKELREIILKFIDEEIDPYGDVVANVTLALHL